MGYTIKNAISSTNVPKWGNEKKFIAIHYLGVTGESHELANDGCGAHFYIYKDGTIWQRCALDAIVWQVGTAGYYTQKHAQARNANTIGIEMCVNCDGDSSTPDDKKWWFTTKTQEACVWLVKKLMAELNIPVDHVLRHYDIVNKVCPAPYVHNNKYRTSWTWDEFKSKLTTASSSKQITKAKELNGLSEKQKIAKIAPLYQEVMTETGMLASVGLAQFCLESGYGTTDLAQNANNLHGMKTSLSGNNWPGSSWDGTSKYTKITEEEDANGKRYSVEADFRAYKCVKDSIRDRAAYFIGAKNGAAQRYPDINKITDPLTQIKAIKTGGYATDHAYVNKLWSIVQRFNLTQYDTSKTKKTASKKSKKKTSYRIQTGAYTDKDRAIAQVAFVTTKSGYGAFYELDSTDNLYKVYCGSFESVKNANARINDLKVFGISAFVKTVKMDC